MQHLQFNLTKTYSDSQLPAGSYNIKLSVSPTSSVQVGIDSKDFLSASVLINS